MRKKTKLVLYIKEAQMPGKIIVIDGPDGTGKQTTTSLVKQLLQERQSFEDRAVLTQSFPDYHEFFGKQVRAYLDGDSAHELVRVPEEIRKDPLLASMPYAEDRYRAYTDKMRSNLDQDCVYVLDRYVQSNMAHQGAKIPDLNDRDAFCAKIIMLEHSVFTLPHADLVITLCLDEAVRDSRVRRRRQQEAGKTGQVGFTDIHEQDDRYMAEVAEEYCRLAKLYGWSTIDCNREDYELTPEEVAEEAYQIIVTKLC